MIVTPITLLVLLGILGFGAWWGYREISKPLPGNVPTPCVTTPAKELTSSQVAVRVLNGGYTTGLGTKVGKALEVKGFKVLFTGNSKERIKKTVIVASTADAPEAKLVLGFFKDATIRPDARVDATVDVLVGSEYGDMNADAPTSIAVSSGSVCVPVMPSPSGSGSPAASGSPVAASPSPSPSS